MLIASINKKLFILKLELIYHHKNIISFFLILSVNNLVSQADTGLTIDEYINQY